MINELTKRTDEFVNSLIDTQKKMWNTVSDSLQSVTSAPADKRWQEGVKASEKLVQDSLDAQADLRRSMLDRLAEIDAMPEQAVESLDRFQDIADELTKSQEKLISNCFDMLETLDPNRVAGSYGDSFSGVVDRLQNLARKTVEVQMEMVKNWTGKKPTTSSSARKRPVSKKSTSKK